MFNKTFLAKQKDLEDQIASLTSQLAEANKKLELQSAPKVETPQVETPATETTTTINLEEEVELETNKTIASAFEDIETLKTKIEKLEAHIEGMEKQISKENESNQEVNQKVQIKVIEELAKVGSPSIKGNIPTSIPKNLFDNERVRSSENGRYTFVKMN